MKALFAAIVLFATQSLMAQEASQFLLVGDETLLTKVKASPNDYIGMPVIVMGEIEISDYYNYKYNNLTNLFYSLRFREITKESIFPPNGEVLHLYLDRTLKPIADMIIESNSKVIRVKAEINPRRFDASGPTWDMMEIKDVQFSVDGKWTDWFIETAEQKAKQESMKAEESARLEREQANEKAAAEKMEKIEKKRVAQTRTWKDKSGKFSIQAEFVGYFDGIVRLK